METSGDEQDRGEIIYLCLPSEGLRVDTDSDVIEDIRALTGWTAKL